MLRSTVIILTMSKYGLILGHRQSSLFILYLLSVMRVIERQMIQAIIERKNFKKANTEVIKDGDFMYIYLHDNLIAKYGLNDNWGQLFISHCNWLTNTTKSRLNALISFVDGLGGIYQKNFRWYLDTKKHNNLNITNNSNFIEV